MPLIFSWVFHVPFASTLCFSADINFFYHLFQVSSSLISRVSTADQNFNKDMELTPRIATEFDLTLDSGPALHAIQTMNFFQLKGTAAVLSKFSNLLWRWRSDLAHYESEYSFFLHIHCMLEIKKYMCVSLLISGLHVHESELFLAISKLFF